MKKIHSLGILSLFFLLVIGGILFFLLMQKEVIPETTLAQEQKVVSSLQGETTKKVAYISPEKQKQLNQITEIYTNQEIAHRALVANIMRKYNSNFSQNDKEILLGILNETDSVEQLAATAREKIAISFLKTDIKKMINSHEELKEEKELELTRLESFKKRNIQDLNSNSKRLIELSLINSITKNTTLSSQEITEISGRIILKIFNNDSQLFTLTIFEQQEALIKNALTLTINPLSTLSKSEKQTLIVEIIADLSKLEILQKPTATKSDETSFIPIFEGFQKLGFLIIPQTHASEVSDLSAEELEILILKTEIFIERILQESIETEILYNKGEISIGEYEAIIQENLISLEELVILKESLENDPNTLSLDDIQRFNLGEYVDDSTEIQNLPVLSYIQEKSGHIIIYNLNGSTKLGEENMSLYSGYSLQTLDNSTLTLVFSDESILKLDPLSRVTISTPTSSNINVAVESGSIWTRVLKPLLSGDIFTIDSDGVSLGVRGTSVSLIKSDVGTSINIVDSYTPDSNSSVTFSQDSAAETTLTSGKEISIDSDKNITLSDVNRAELLSREPQIAEFLRDDLTYISLLLDDRKRGFYNTPFVGKNDGDNFLQKIAGELEVTLPQTDDKSYIIKDDELSGELISTGSIYHLIKKDILISAIKNNSIGNTTVKIAAVRNLDMQELEEELGSKRELENRFDLSIINDISSEDIFTTSELKNIFLNFPIEDAQNKAKLLAQAKKELSINNGSNIVTGNISPLPDLSGEPVSIKWKSSDSSIISNTGIAPPQDIKKSVILTATLSIGKLSTTKDFGLTVIPSVPTPEEELQAAQDLLTYRIDSFQNVFYDEIELPDFSEDGGITPIIKWIGSELVNEDGSTNRPSFTQSQTEEFKYTNVTALLSHPLFPDITKEKLYNNIGIKRENITDAELLIQAQDLANQLLLTAKQAFNLYFLQGLDNNEFNLDSGITTISNSLSHPTLPDGIVVNWKGGDTTINLQGEVTQPTFNQPSIPTKTVTAVFKHEVTQLTMELTGVKLKVSNQECDGKIIGTGANQTCYDRIAKAEYNSDYKLGNLTPTNTVNRPEFIEIGTERGVNPLSSSGDFLSYDLSSLELGEDWAIEMSVRGEDLGRSGLNNGLLSIPGSIYIYQYNGQLKKSDASGIDGFLTNSLNGYQNILLTKNGVFLNSNKIMDTGLTSLGEIKIGSHKDSKQQWNGIINYVKILKKKD